MSDGLQFDEAISRKVEALYLTPDVVAQRCQVLKALELKQGERVLDIGSGPGLLAYDIAASVGHKGRVCGIDISDDMLTMSRKRCVSQPWTDFQTADATKLPYLDDSFDAVVSTQVYEYVANVPAALAELHRVVRAGGRASCDGHRLRVTRNSRGERASHGAGVIGLERTFRSQSVAPHIVSSTCGIVGTNDTRSEVAAGGISSLVTSLSYFYR
jgi:SAM-dependent methyltransferase